jgi:hypothetical protein
VSECTEAGDVVVAMSEWVSKGKGPEQARRSSAWKSPTHNGTWISTASATRFSISRSMCRLYLDLT